MAVISKAGYISLANYLGNTKGVLLSAKETVYDAVYDIAILDDITQSIDLLSPFFASYESVTSTTQFNTSLNAAIQSLNNHVIRRTRGSLDTFLTGSPDSLHYQFVIMSRDLGFDISDDFINPATQ